MITRRVAAVGAFMTATGLLAGTARSRDNAGERPRDAGDLDGPRRQAVSRWFHEARAPDGRSCCNEADGYREGVPRARDGAVIFKSWNIKPDGTYRINVSDPIDLTPKELFWDGPIVTQNPTGTAIVWLRFDYPTGSRVLGVRCFSPGSEG